MEQINGEGFIIEENVFKNNSSHVAYPLIVSGADSKQLDTWNGIILEDVSKILKLYSAYAFTPNSEVEKVFQPDILNISYKIKRNDSPYLSIFYIADFFSPYAAYPTELIYTTNIDIESSRRIKLSDIIEVEEFLVDDLSSWDLVIKDNSNKEYLQAIRDYIDGLGRKVLWMGIRSADIIGPDNYLGIFSYLTPDKIGVSISVPNYLGDHVEFERSLLT